MSEVMRAHTLLSLLKSPMLLKAERMWLLSGVMIHRDILAKEASLEEESRLVIQILETHRTLALDDVVRVLNTIADVFNKRINDD